jgi:hypothetical protein
LMNIVFTAASPVEHFEREDKVTDSNKWLFAAIDWHNITLLTVSNANSCQWQNEEDTMSKQVL